MRISGALVLAAVLVTAGYTPAAAQPSLAAAPPDDSAASEPQVTVRFFGDVSAVRGADGTTSFALGQMDLFATARVGDRWQFLSETLAEGSVDNTVAFELERLLIQFLAPKGIRVAVGRFHTAIGYYNDAYHHGLWFQTAASRPRMFEFEDLGGLLPVHQVGVTASGPIPSAGAGLRWIAEIGNGRGRHSEEVVQSTRDHNRHKTVNLAIVGRPARYPGLQFGLARFVDQFQSSSSTTTDQSIVAVHLAYAQSRYEWLSEYARVRHASQDAAVSYVDTWYLQAARQFGRVRPFLRYESIDADPHDTEYGQIGHFRGPSMGARVDVASGVALKVQADVRRDGNGRKRSAIAQVAFVF